MSDSIYSLVDIHLVRTNLVRCVGALCWCAWLECGWSYGATTLVDVLDRVAFHMDSVGAGCPDNVQFAIEYLNLDAVFTPDQ